MQTLLDIYESESFPPHRLVAGYSIQHKGRRLPQQPSRPPKPFNNEMDPNSLPCENESIKACLQLFIKKILHLGAESVALLGQLQADLTQSESQSKQIISKIINMVEEHSISLKDLANKLARVDMLDLCAYFPRLAGDLLTALLNSKYAHMHLNIIHRVHQAQHIGSLGSIDKTRTATICEYEHNEFYLRGVGGVTTWEAPAIHTVTLFHMDSYSTAIKESASIIEESKKSIIGVLEAEDTCHRWRRLSAAHTHPKPSTSSGYPSSDKSSKGHQESVRSIPSGDSEWGHLKKSDSQGMCQSVAERSEEWIDNISNLRAVLKDCGGSVSSASERPGSEDGNSGYSSNNRRKLGLIFQRHLATGMMTRFP